MRANTNITILQKPKLPVTQKTESVEDSNISNNSVNNNATTMLTDEKLKTVSDFKAALISQLKAQASHKFPALEKGASDLQGLFNECSVKYKRLGLTSLKEEIKEHEQTCAKLKLQMQTAGEDIKSQTGKEYIETYIKYATAKKAHQERYLEEKAKNEGKINCKYKRTIDECDTWYQLFTLVLQRGEMVLAYFYGTIAYEMIAQRERSERNFDWQILELALFHLRFTSYHINDKQLNNLVKNYAAMCITIPKTIDRLVDATLLENYLNTINPYQNALNSSTTLIANSNDLTDTLNAIKLVNSSDFQDKPQDFDIFLKKSLLFNAYRGVFLIKALMGEEKKPTDYEKGLTDALTVLRSIEPAFELLNYDTLSDAEFNEITQAIYYSKCFAARAAAELMDSIYNDDSLSHREKRLKYIHIQRHIHFINKCINRLQQVGCLELAGATPENTIASFNRRIDKFRLLFIETIEEERKAKDNTKSIESTESAKAYQSLMQQEKARDRKKKAKSQMKQQSEIEDKNKDKKADTNENKKEIKNDNNAKQKLSPNPNSNVLILKKLPPQKQNALQTQFQEGEALMNQKNFEAAIVVFKEVYKTAVKKPNTTKTAIEAQCNIAECHMILGSHFAKLGQLPKNKYVHVTGIVSDNMKKAYEHLKDGIDACQIARFILNEPNKLNSTEKIDLITFIDWINIEIQESSSDLNKDRDAYLKMMNDYQKFLESIGKWRKVDGKKKSKVSEGVKAVRKLNQAASNLEIEGISLQLQAANDAIATFDKKHEDNIQKKIFDQKQREIATFYLEKPVKVGEATIDSVTLMVADADENFEDNDCLTDEEHEKYMEAFFKEYNKQETEIMDARKKDEARHQNF